MPLMTVSMAIIIVLYSAYVVHIPPLVVIIFYSRIPIVQESTLTHFWGVR
jgi:hypothetical protein